jgi:hypothetical protein
VWSKQIELGPENAGYRQRQLAKYMEAFSSNDNKEQWAAFNGLSNFNGVWGDNGWR